jgi:hypothetical protein
LHFYEINLFGVYVAPIAIILVIAWLVLLPVRRLVNRFGLLRHVWHPALFEFAIYLIVVSVIVLAIAPRSADRRPATGCRRRHSMLCRRRSRALRM